MPILGRSHRYPQGAGIKQLNRMWLHAMALSADPASGILSMPACGGVIKDIRPGTRHCPALLQTVPVNPGPVPGGPCGPHPSSLFDMV